MIRKHMPIVLLVLSVILLICGCSSSSSSSHNMAAEVRATSAPQVAYDIAGEASLVKLDDMGAGTVVPLAQGRKIIYTADFSIRTYAFDQDVASIRDAVTQSGGYFETNSVSNYGGKDSPRNAHMIMRVPQTEFEGLLTFLRGVGEVTHENSNANDVSDTYVDYEIRVDVLKQNLERLQELQEKSEDIESIIRLQQEMNDMLLQLERLTSDLRHLDSQIDYATVSLSLQELLEDQLVTMEEDLLGRMGSAFVRSTNGIFSFLRGLMVVASYLMPVLILLAGLFVVVCVIFRLAARRWPFSKKRGSGDKKDI